MLTLLLYGLLAILLIGGLYLVAARLLPAGEQIAPPVRDEPIWALPGDRPLAAADVADVRLPVALRGYRFAETDLLLDRLVEELRARDDEIARLRGPFAATAPRYAPDAGHESYETVALPERAPQRAEPLHVPEPGAERGSSGGDGAGPGAHDG